MQQKSLNQVIGQLCEEAKARTVAVLHSEGHLIEASGDLTKVDLTSLTALAGGVFSAGAALSSIIEEGECDGLFIEGSGQHLYLTKVGGEELLLVLFGGATNEGIVRLRVRQHRRVIENILKAGSAEEIPSKNDPAAEPMFEDFLEPELETSSSSPFQDISDKEIDDALGI